MNFKRDKIFRGMQIRGRQHRERCIVPRSFRFVNFSFTQTFRMDYCKEETRLLFTVARLFRTARENAVKFSFSRDLCVALPNCYTNFLTPLYLLFLRKKCTTRCNNHTFNHNNLTRIIPKIYLFDFQSSYVFSKCNI